MPFQQVPSALASHDSLSPCTWSCGSDLRIPPAAPILVKPGGQGQEAAWTLGHEAVYVSKSAATGSEATKGITQKGEERAHSKETLTRGLGAELG